MLERIAFALVMLGVASYSDIKIREVPDLFWLPFIGIGGLWTLAYFITDAYSPIELFIGIGLVSIIAWIGYFTRLYGGADAKALTILALILPIYDMGSWHNYAILTVITNTMLLGISVPVIFLTINLNQMARGKNLFEGFEASRISKLKAMLVGIRKKKIGKFDYSLERTVDGKRQLNFSTGSIENVLKTGSDAWVSPGIPLLVFISLGFLTTITFGDLLYKLFMGV